MTGRVEARVEDETIAVVARKCPHKIVARTNLVVEGATLK
jgi:hypothetical protein